MVRITRVPISSSPDSIIADQTSKLLQHHLTNSPIEPDEAGIPFANPSSDLRFSSFVSLFSPSDRSYEALLFRLGHALFDDIDLHLGDSITVDIRNRVASLRRKVALSSWLAEAVAPAVEADLRKHPGAGSVAVAFVLLTGNQVEKACETAMDSGNVKLATLISQASGDAELQADLRAQLQIWREQRIDAHIDENIRKIYALLAGIVGVVEGSKGTGIERCPDIDLSKDLDWKRTFGLYLWFSEPLDASIAQVFDSYSRHWRDSPNDATSPRPSYQEHSTAASISSRWRLPSSTPPVDALFSLIKLHADPACSLSHILMPSSFGPSPADYSLPWHLYILLSRCMRVRDFADRGDPGIEGLMETIGDEEVRVEGHSPSADLLASSYAFQLEQVGLVQEAVFVLLHIEGSVGWIVFLAWIGQSSSQVPTEEKRLSKIFSPVLPVAWTSG
jgi:nuclear pore complex protein Nup98-Nup96